MDYGYHTGLVLGWLILAGAFQWLVLQGRLPSPWCWVIATTVGWMAGYLLTFFGIPVELEIFSGVIIGWTTGLTLLLGLLLTGTLAGALTGLGLEILLRNPKPKGFANQRSAQNP